MRENMVPALIFLKMIISRYIHFLENDGALSLWLGKTSFCVCTTLSLSSHCWRTHGLIPCLDHNEQCRSQYGHVDVQVSLWQADVDSF